MNETSIDKKEVVATLYEGLREYCEAIIYSKGYKVMEHVSITYFIRDILRDEVLSQKFDRFRKLRNGVNYYGSDLNKETVQEALISIPSMIKELKKYFDSN